MTLAKISKDDCRILVATRQVVTQPKMRPRIFSRESLDEDIRQSGTYKPFLSRAAVSGARETVNLPRVLGRWLHSLALWSHAATFTCKRHDENGYPINERILIDTAGHLIHRLNYKCFRKRARRGQSVGVTMTLGWGVYEIHPHIHGSFECPGHLSYDEFSDLLNRSANETFWIDRERCIKTYDNAGWMDYMVEHGADQLIVPLIRPSRFV